MVEAKQRKIVDGINIFLIILLSLTFIIPVILILSASFTSAEAFTKYGYTFFPKQWSLVAYKYIFTSHLNILRALLNSVFVTVTGTVLMVVNCSLFAYAITRKQFLWKKFFSFFAIFTMLFGGGTIPYYLVVTGLGLDDSLFAIILPGAVSAWNIILMKNFFLGIPDSLCEAASIDGAGNLYILVKIVAPLSFPVIASVILFTAVGFWNNWFGPLLFIKTQEKQPAQAILRAMQDQSGILKDPSGKLPTEAIKNAAIIVTTLPIVIVYPFLQKYFINGVIVGAVKG